MSMLLMNRWDSLLSNAMNSVHRNAHRGADVIRNAFRPDGEPAFAEDDGPV